MTLNDLLGELGHHLGRTDLCLNEQGVCRVVFDETLVVDFEESQDKQTAYIYSMVMRLPDEDREAFYQTLLEANLFGRATGNASFGIDAEAGEAMLFLSLEPNKYDVLLFEKVLEDFLNVLSTWKAFLEHGDFKLSALEEEVGEIEGTSDNNEEFLRI